MSKYSQKRRIVEHCLSELPQFNLKVDEAMLNWWVNRSGGFRLSPHGYRVFVEYLKLKQYCFDISAAHSISSKFLLDADRKLESPYYISTKDCLICLFGSKEATAVRICGDNFLEYLEWNC